MHLVRREIATRPPKERWIRIHNHPGIARLEKWNPVLKRWIDPRHDAYCRLKVFCAYRRIRVLGKSTLQKKHFQTIREAKAWRLEANPEPTARKAIQVTVGDAIEGWREWSKPPRFRKTSWLQYAKDVRHAESLKDAPIEGLTAQDIDRWLQHLKDPSYPKQKTRVSFERELSTLQTIFRWYRERRNEKFQHPILARHRQDSYFRDPPLGGIEVLSAHQAEEFFARISARHSPVFQRTAALQLFAGLRIGEACGLYWDCVDFEGRTITVRRSCIWPQPAMRAEIQDTTKTSSVRSIPIVDRLYDLIVTWKAEDGEMEIVCHKAGRLIRRNTVAGAYGKVFRQLELRVKSVTHILRRTFATLHAEQTRDLAATQALLGHTDIQTTQIYAKVTDGAVRRSMPDFAFGRRKS
ncbi:MAG: site-specific integrase [Pseudomonadota bacterium]